MKLAVITDAYPPMRSSGAVLMRDLCAHMAARGHDVTVLVPDAGLSHGHAIEQVNGVRVVRLKTRETRDRAYAVRLLAEMAMPFAMRRRLRQARVELSDIDGVVWYSPSIFFGPLARSLKRDADAPGYLILRDIFPEWAADLGLIKRGPAFRLLQSIARFQYRVADTIGVQTPGNLAFFAEDIACGKRVEVLQNWTDPGAPGGCAVSIADGPLAGRTVFVYAGNMGVAQGMDKLIDLAAQLDGDDRIGFLFVGRGSDVPRLRADVAERGLTNCVFHDEIDPDDMPGLFEQCHVGLVSLDHRHTWHNIPGKFIAYTHAGLPVLASVNPGNDLVELIEGEGVGRVSIDSEGRDLAKLALELVDNEERAAIGRRSRDLAQRLFSVEAAAMQIERALRGDEDGTGG